MSKPEDTRTADPGGLDVERLAEAMRACDGVAWPKRWTPGDFDWIARQVAAKYAALTPEATAPDPAHRFCVQSDPCWPHAAQPEDDRTADPGGLREAPSVPIEAAAHPEHYRLGWRHAMAQAAFTPEATAPERTADPELDPALLGDDPDDPEDVAWLAHHSVPAPEATAPDARE